MKNIGDGVFEKINNYLGSILFFLKETVPLTTAILILILGISCLKYVCNISKSCDVYFGNNEPLDLKMWHYHQLVPLHSRIFSPINKFYTSLIFIYSFLISTGVSYIFFTTKSVTMTGHFFLLLPDLKWNQPFVFTFNA